jgi:predicted methyltransferase
MTKGPLISLPVAQVLRAARDAMAPYVECSLDLGRSQTRVQTLAGHWAWNEREFPYLERCKERTIYHWTGKSFEPVASFSQSLVKLVPTEWGAPTFEIDGIKMLPSAQLSPYEDARRKVELIKPRGKVILDTCGGLGYFAAWCLQGGARQIVSFEKNPDVLWLRQLNPWSPGAAGALELNVGDIVEQSKALAEGSFDAILHDPPRFGIAGELYSQEFYDRLARLLKKRGILFHYTGTPNKLTSNRDVPNEVAGRLKRAGFSTRFEGDGVLAIKS